MKKQLINPTTRKLIMIGTSLLIIILAFVSYYMFNDVEIIEIEKEGLTYTWEENITWKTRIIANPMISKRILGTDDFIYRDLTEMIDVSFDVPIVSETPMTFTGTATLKASLMSVYGEEKDIIWEKVDINDVSEVILVGDSLSFSDSQAIKIMPHKTFIGEVEENYTLVGSYLYVFSYVIDGVIENDFGKHDIHIEPKVEFPIMDMVGKGTTILSEETEFVDIIKESIEQNTKQTIALITLSITVLIILCFIIFLIITRSDILKDEFDRFSKSFLREYGDRMVSIPKSLSLQYGNVMNVKDPVDMIKAADEISQLIFYYYINNSDQRKLEMFVFDDVRVYYFVRLGVVSKK